MVLGPALADYALAFGPPEYFALMVLALSLITAFTGKSLTRGLISTLFGLLLGCVGDDVISGDPRLTFGISGLLDGIQFLPVAVGLFGVSEMIESLLEKEGVRILKADFGCGRCSPAGPTSASRRGRSSGDPFWASWSGSCQGPGRRSPLFSLTVWSRSYRSTRSGSGKALSRGCRPGTANNASTGGAFVPMLSLGIPSWGRQRFSRRVMLFGLHPGPGLFKEAPDVVWGLIASMYIGNVALAVLNIGFIPLMVLIMDRISPYIRVVVLILAIMGVYSFRNTTLDVVVMTLRF